MPNRFKSLLLVTLQFFFIFFLLKDAPFNRLPLAAYIFILLSVLLVSWAILAMQKSKLRIMPEPAADAILVTNGPYRFIRHPMYTAILFGAAGLLMSHFTWVRLAVSVALFIVLIIKLKREEKMLLLKFDGYKNYMAMSSRLFPFLF